jgi:hypothetical protein
VRNLCIASSAALFCSVSFGETIVQTAPRTSPWTLGANLAFSNDYISNGIRLTSPSAYSFFEERGELRYYLKADMLSKDQFVGSNFGGGLQLQYKLNRYLYPYISGGLARLDAPNSDPKLGVEAGTGLAFKFNVTNDVSAALSVGAFKFWGRSENSVAAFMK